MLHEPGAPNIAAFENQVKQHTLSDHWKSIKTLFLEKNKWLVQKRQKKIDWNTRFNKRFHILQNEI